MSDYSIARLLGLDPEAGGQPRREVNPVAVLPALKKAEETEDKGKAEKAVNDIGGQSSPMTEYQGRSDKERRLEEVDKQEKELDEEDKAWKAEMKKRRGDLVTKRMEIMQEK